MKPLISVIIPVFNTEKLLQKCIDSLLNQTLKDIEIILVNDGSTDDSLEICVDNQRKDSRVIVIDKPNGGAASARNAGISRAIGEYIAFVDSDDWVDKKMYEEMYKKAKSTESDTCLCGFIVEKNGKQIQLPIQIQDRIFSAEEIKKDILPRFLGPKSLKRGNDDSIEISAVRGIYKRIMLEENSLSFVSGREILAEDLPFDICVLYFSNRMCISKSNFYHYYRHNQSVQRRYDNYYWEKIYLACHETQHFLMDKQLGMAPQLRLDNRIFDFALRAISRETGKNCPKKTFERLNKIKEICNTEGLQESLDRIDKRGIGFRKKFLSYCLKNKLAIPLYLYFNTFNVLIKIIDK